MKRRQPRGQRRYLERRHIAYNLKYCPPTRHSIPSEELASLIDSILINRIASFGIKHIHTYDLDVIFPVRSDMKALAQREVSMTNMITLAASMNRDQIISCLLKAGANPMLVPLFDDEIRVNSDLEKRVQRFFLSDDLSTYFAIYIVKFYIASLFDTMHKACQACSRCGNPDMCCLEFYPCNHAVCIECFWRNVCISHFRDLTCSCCQEIVLPNPKWFITLPTPMSIEISISADVKRTSREKFQSLSLNFNDSAVEKRPKIAALPFSRAVSLFIGSNQTQRMYEFFKAATLGNILRLKSLIEAGVDIDARNEYGQTVLHIACWKGYADIVTLLISMNADVSIRDNVGYLAIQVAEHNQHVDIVETIKLASSHTLEDVNIFQRVVSIRDDDMNSAYIVKHLPVTCEYPIVGWNETFTIENIFPDSFLSDLATIGCRIPVAPREKICHSDRAYFCDMDGDVSLALEQAILSALSNIHKASDDTPMFQVRVYAHMRFLIYRERLGALPAHVDLSRTADDSIDFHPPVKSTHTFILYLSTCDEGGCTVLLHSAKYAADGENVIASIRPLRGRLLVFPHQCPHAGQEVESVPKLLLRGEVCIEKIE